MRIDLTLYSATLARSTARVEDDLGVDACKEDKTDDPIGVA